MTADEWDGEGWDEYDSAMMFPGCDCGHDADEHEAAWGEWREQFRGPDAAEGCGVPGCPCEVRWEHS